MENQDEVTAVFMTDPQEWAVSALQDSTCQGCHKGPSGPKGRRNELHFLMEDWQGLERKC